MAKKKIQAKSLSGNPFAEGSRNYFKTAPTKNAVKSAYGKPLFNTKKYPDLAPGNVGSKAAARQTLKKRSVGSKRKK